MKSYSVSDFPKIGINLLTGEACAFSMRVLCDVNDEGADLIKSFFGVAQLEQNWNSQVNGRPAVGSVMLTRSVFRDLLMFKAWCDGYRWVMYHEQGDSVTAYNPEDLDKNEALKMYHEEVFNMTRTYRRVCVNPNWSSTAPSVGGRNVHAFTGRTV